ncbi:ficolin-1-A-like [Anopheles moucheti]|uniref:ficolin-1-A-like n=1 Tax=Anopheles moucheti TaxID=186751 RepID=UPI0022F0808B|nr:ficolin-1-A-like [Anopheles moucheti]
MQFVHVITVLVICNVATANKQDTLKGFGFELLQTQLAAFEARMQKQLDGIQDYVSNTTMNRNSGVYFVNLTPALETSFKVYRDGTNNHGFGSNWTVFQRRFDGSVDFNRNWTEYKHGFGDIQREHWLGLDKLKSILDTERHELLIVMEDFEGVTAFAKYDNFRIANESERYALQSLGTYTGIVRDCFSSQLRYNFSTPDQDNSGRCADIFKGGGWYSNCYQSNLNGMYLKGGKQNNNKGIHWYYFRGYQYSLKATKMMVRPYAQRSKT